MTDQDKFGYLIEFYWREVNIHLKRHGRKDQIFYISKHKLKC